MLKWKEDPDKTQVGCSLEHVESIPLIYSYLNKAEQE